MSAVSSDAAATVPDDTTATATATASATVNPDTTTTTATQSSQASQAAGKKDRKPKRQGLPLPDPIPETPVKRYTEPSRTELQKKIDEEDAKIQACFDRLNLTRSFFDQRQKIRETSKPAFDAARKDFVQLNEECRTLFDERKNLSTQIKALKDADMAARGNPAGGQAEMAGAGKDGNDALKNVRTMEELDEKIGQMKYRLETESMPIIEEKRIVAQISFLTHKGREFIRGRDQSFKSEQAAKEARVVSRRGLEDARSALDTRIDAAKAKLDEKKKVVDEIKEKEEGEVKKLQENTPTIDRDEEKKKIAELKGIIRKLRDEFSVELDQWYLNERIYYEQQKLAKKKKFEAAQAEREARRKALEAEQAQYPEPHPYQDEKDMCAALTVYLQTLIGETAEKPAVNLRASGQAGSPPSLKSNGAVREISASGTAIGKMTVSNDDGFTDLNFADFVKKSGKKGKRGRRGTPSVGGDASAGTDGNALKLHPIDYLTAFTKLDVKPPNRLSEVRAALEAVKSKAAFYETAPAPTAEEKAERSKKPDGAAKAKKSVASASTSGAEIMNGDSGSVAFPGLGSDSGNARSRSMDASLPSFKAVASGVASAPAHVPTMTANLASLSVSTPVEDPLPGEAEVEENETPPPAEVPLTES